MPAEATAPPAPEPINDSIEPSESAETTTSNSEKLDLALWQAELKDDTRELFSVIIDSSVARGEIESTPSLNGILENAMGGQVPDGMFFILAEAHELGVLDDVAKGGSSWLGMPFNELCQKNPDLALQNLQDVFAWKYGQAGK